MSARKLNVKLLRKIQKHILAEPKRYDQNIWLEREDPKVNPSYPACGTMACIGGWAQILSSKKRVAEPSWGQAQRLLCLSWEQAGRLFDSVSGCSEWPYKFAAAYANAKTPRQKARVAVRRIDHFIKTKGAE